MDDLKPKPFNPNWNPPKVNQTIKQGVYVVKCLQYYKIGIAKDIDKRVKGMQTGNPFDIEKVMVISIPGRSARSIESGLHILFSAKKVKGEWFMLSHEDVIRISIDYDADLLCDLDDITEENDVSIAVDKIAHVSKSFKAHKESKKAEFYKLNKIIEHINGLSGYSLSTHGESIVRGWISKKYSVEEILEGVDISFGVYFFPYSGGEEDNIHWGTAINKVSSIVRNKRMEKSDPDLPKLYYIRGIIRNRFGGEYHKEGVLTFLKKSRDSGLSATDLQVAALDAGSWDGFKEDVGQLVFTKSLIPF